MRKLKMTDGQNDSFFWGGRTGASVCSYDVSIPPFSKKLSPRARQAIFSDPKSYLLKPSKLSSFFTPFLTLGERHMIRQITADRYYHDTIRNADTETRHNEVNNLYKMQNIFKGAIKVKCKNWAIVPKKAPSWEKICFQLGKLFFPTRNLKLGVIANIGYFILILRLSAQKGANLTR